MKFAQAFMEWANLTDGRLDVLETDANRLAIVLHRELRANLVHFSAFV